MMSNEDQNEDRNGHQIDVTPSSGNVFADLGRPDADELLLKAQLVWHVSRVITKRALTQLQAAEILGIDQPKVLRLLRGYLSEFSVEQLIRYLVALSFDVEIVLKEKPTTHEPGSVAVHAA